MSLFEKLNKIDKRNWQYYACRYANDNFEQAYSHADIFVQNYFCLGGKSNFIPNTIFSYENNTEYITRIKHVVSSYFLGIYLLDKIQFLQPGRTSFLAKNNNQEFLWAWFLCSLYHDAFYNIEDDITDNAELEQLRDCHFGYCKNSWRLLYDKKTIKRYYEKNINRMKSFDGKVHYDHGILGAEWLFENYNNSLKELLNLPANYEAFSHGYFLTCGELFFDKKHFYSLCNIAKIIASHNIHICNGTDNDKNKYELAELTNLIPENIDFHKMPYNKYSKFGVYDKLYLLLSVVDSIEPTKRGIDLSVLDIDVINNSIEIKLPNDNIAHYHYAKTQLELNTWLNYINVSVLNKDNEYIIKYEINRNE